MRRLLWLIGAFGLVAIVALRSYETEGEKSRREVNVNLWLADSELTAQKLVRWRRDSVVIDSIARTIPTDSLRRLYRAAAVAQDPYPAVLAMLCERYRLMNRYGSRAVRWAVAVVDSTAWTPDEKRHVEARLPAQLWFDETEHCPPPSDEAPKRIGDTDLWGPFQKPSLWPKPE